MLADTQTSNLIRSNLSEGADVHLEILVETDIQNNVQISNSTRSSLSENTTSTTKDESIYRLTPEFYAKEREITKQWLSRVMPTIIQGPGAAGSTSWTWFRDWLSNHSRFAHKLAIMASNSTLEKRLETFKNFPKVLEKLSIEKIAEAGFFYLDYGTSCKCFCCGGVLGSWKDTDDPFSLHALFYPYCEFLMLEKGGRFIIKTSYEYRLGDKNNVSSKTEVKEELKEINDAVACIVCLNKKINVYFIPCGHTSCSECVLKLKNCASCRIPIKAALKLFLP